MGGFKYKGVEKLLKGAFMAVRGDFGAAGLKPSAREGVGEGRKERVQP